MSVAPERRFSPSRPCPVCGGHDQLSRGNNERCYGFLSEDGQWAHCTREGYAGGLKQNPESRTYAHRLVGNCGCGVQHGQGPLESGDNGSRQWRKIVETYIYIVTLAGNRSTK